MTRLYSWVLARSTCMIVAKQLIMVSHFQGKTKQRLLMFAFNCREENRFKYKNCDLPGATADQRRLFDEGWQLSLVS